MASRACRLCKAGARYCRKKGLPRCWLRKAKAPRI
ncbi:hypothetical protein H206_05231 [Candidatus Electrothrix aarhusensis]|uniref:Uncharacterized protein n=1 Tax=Candidatus Electrothrix aarhusensis TaxID=1859131 RepID=A0A3S3SR57_9BACT|nr:hypothetical protein H206_05231 [Candidatus Electrothrix aarhusensis]